MLPAYILLHCYGFMSIPRGWLPIVATSIILSCCFSSVELLSIGRNKEQKYDYIGAQVLNIERFAQLNSFVEKNHLNIWSGNGTHIAVIAPANKINFLKKKLKNKLISYEVMIQDLGEVVSRAMKFRNITSEKKGYQMDWNNYQRLGVIHSYLDYLAVTFPGIVQVGTMGVSTEGRPLKYIRIFSENSSSKAIFIDGGVHAREWISPSSVTYIIKELVQKRNRQPFFLRNLEVYILPVLNPDGYEYSFTDDRLWRKNRSKSNGSCAGTDINRNFDFNWDRKGASLSPCSEVYRGTAPASEPETRAVSKFIMDLKGKIRAYLSYHSYGQYILAPYGYDYNARPVDYTELKAVGDLAIKNIYKASSVKYQAGNAADLVYPASGCSNDWAKAIGGVKYSYIIELRDKGDFSFLLPPGEIIPTAVDAMEALKAIASATYRL